MYYEQITSGLRNLVWVDESGSVSPITREAKYYGYTAISSDAQNIAGTVSTDEGGYQIEIINTETGNSTLFAKDAICPSWSADNSSIYYTSSITDNQVFQKPIDLSSPPVLLFGMDSVRRVRIRNLTSDRRYLPVYVLKDIERDIGYYDMVNGEVKMLEHYNTDGNDLRTAISPDGKWVAYSSNNIGQVAIYVAPFPGPGQLTRITLARSTNDIYFPIWAPDMTALYYATSIPDFEIWKVEMQFYNDNFSFNTEQSIFNGGSRFVLGNDVEIHPNGDRFLVHEREVTGGQEFIEPNLKVIVNWEMELEGD